MKSKIDISIVGTYPPPIGGMSTHIKRLKNAINDAGKKVNIYDLGSVVYKDNDVIPVPNTYLWLLMRFFQNSEAIIHYHGASWKHRAIFAIFQKLKKGKTVYTFHSLRECTDDFDTITRCCFKLTRHLVDHFIVVGPHLCKKLINWGFNPEKISIIPAYIPPNDDEKNTMQLPLFFREIRQKHNFLITANAFRISFHDNLDLYGIDLSIELMKRLKESGFSNVGFVFVIPEVGDYEYYEKMQNLIKEYCLEDCFYFYTEPVPYAAVINICDLFIRPTNTDGDALSIRESIAINRPTIASDAAPRPEGTLLFPSRDINALYSKVIEVNQNYAQHTKIIEQVEFEDNAKKILDIYNSLLSCKD